MPTVEELMRASGIELREARILVAHALGVTTAAIAARPEHTPDQEQCSRIRDALARRRSGEPIAYITEEREFYGLALHVTPAVLIPRPETELLAEIALAAVRDGERVLELGTGSGAVAVALAIARPSISVTACDTSEEALAIARHNASRHGARVNFLRSDWFSAFGEQRFHVIVANPPYVASADPHLESGDLRYEPRPALEAGATGLEQLVLIAHAARDHLIGAGLIAMEHGHDQGPACERLLLQAGYREVNDVRDLAGIPRVIIGRFDHAAPGR